MTGVGIAELPRYARLVDRLPIRSVIVVFLVALVAAACTSEGDATTTSSTEAPVLSTTSSTTTTTSPPTSTAPPSTTTTAPEPTTTTTTMPIEDLRVRWAEVANGFDSPVLLVAAPHGTDVIVEQPGRIVSVDGDVLLDIRDDVVFGGERGLLGLAYHPEFASNGLAYVNYIDGNGDTAIAQFSVGEDGVFDRESQTRILTVGQPAANHNGGMITFGPDGYLWIGMGDGGGADDRFGQGQRADTLLGAMLRIAVGPDVGGAYAIPPDNPFVDGGGAREVWAIGLRNPWRFSFDGDDLWIADVGQRRIEEVDLTDATDPGLNYGWPIMEGSECFRGSCSTDGLVLPIIEYSHSEGCSITGGAVYRGSAMPELAGHFFYSDFCTGFSRSVTSDGATYSWTEQVGTIAAVTGFGIGTDGELYAVSQRGTIHRLERDS